jgi:hypothetical protein
MIGSVAALKLSYGTDMELIPSRVRAQLLAAGVPAWKHTHDGLLSLFPGALNVGAIGLDAHDLAEVLVHLVTRGIVAVSEMGTLTSLKKVEPGWHFCQFYRDDAQLLDMVAPYIAEGLKDDEGCFWVLPSSTTADAACDALSQSLPDVSSYLADGRLELGFHRDWYLDSSARMKTFEDIAGALMIKQEKVLSKGLKFLRAAGDAGWVSGAEQSKDFVDYEMKVNAVLGSTKTAAVCTFRAAASVDELVEIVAAHQNALHNA